MRIGLIAPPWSPVPPTTYGAIETQLHYLATGLQAAGHDVLLVAPGDSTCPVPLRSPFPTAHGPDQWISAELVNAAEGYDALSEVDVVHDHTLAGPLLAERVRRFPVVTTMHWTLEGPIGRLYERLGQALPLVAISRAQTRSAPHVRVAAVIHHGVDAADFPVGDGGGGYCAFLGRMSPDKGVHLAIRAAKAAGIPLRIAAKMSTKDEAAYFDALIRPELGSAVDYLGEARRQEKLELLAGARCLLVPIQWNEPFGLVMIEAMACGTPVVAFARGAAPEVVEHGENGFLCEDSNAMTEAIGRLDEINRLRCRASIEGSFSARRMTAQHLTLYERILNGDAIEGGVSPDF
jgi:glycosyltransferase involved in cell wall biosynthesis